MDMTHSIRNWKSIKERERRQRKTTSTHTHQLESGRHIGRGVKNKQFRTRDSIGREREVAQLL
jgi:hypothetical protein